MNKKYLPSALILYLNYFIHGIGCSILSQQVVKELLAEQVSSSVRWQQSMENLIADGVDTFIEIGPGRTLAGFMRKISRDVTVYNVGTWADVEKVAESLK